MKRDDEDELRSNFIIHLTEYFNDMSEIEFSKINPKVFEEGWPH